VHIRLAPTKLDKLFRVDGAVPLFLHPPDTLIPGRKIDLSCADLWHGFMTATVRTDRHPKNKGVSARFDAADYEIDLPDLVTPPCFVQAGASTVRPLTQVVLRMDERGEVGREEYSVASTAPYVSVLDSGDARLELHSVERQMLQFFTPESYDGETLLFRPVKGIKQQLRFIGHEESGKSAQPEKWTGSPSVSLIEAAQYDVKAPEHPVEAFFFGARYVFRRAGGGGEE